MGESSCFCLPALFSLLSLLLFLLDVVLDLWAIVSLYEEEKYLAMGLLIFLLFASSVLLQIFSWLWYSPDSESKVEKFIIEHGLLALLHILQLGVVLRIIAVVEISVRSFKQKINRKEVTENSNPDLIMLRLFEAFSESAPQLILMMVLIMQMQELHLFTVFKLAGSLSGMAFSVLSYHRKMRQYISDDLQIGWFSSPTVIYFLWNLFVIGPRMVCVSLFASVLPCYIVAHFLSLWTLLVLWAWWQKTDFMNSKPGEWLYRATVALIWYFSWFNVTDSYTKLRRTMYHVVMGLDMMLLYGLWWWRRSVESARLSPLPINIYLLTVMLLLMYIVGVALNHFYFWNYDPKKKTLQLGKKDEEVSDTLRTLGKKDEELFYTLRSLTVFENFGTSDPETAERFDSEGETEARETPKPKTEPETETETGAQKRMKKMANNFFC